MKRFSLIVTLVNTFTTSTQCTCSQLLSQSDCDSANQKALDYIWDIAKLSCSKNTSIPVATIYPTYCEQFSQTNCPTQTGCQWLSTKCSHYTGFTAFQKTTDGECQQISNKCITDGSHCVEKGTCSSCLKQIPCVVSDSGSLCYWDSSATPNVCIDATLCEHLPLSYLTDTQCRTQISTCTIKQGGSFFDCEYALDTCTYGNGTICATKQATCNTYTNSNSCYKISVGKGLLGQIEFVEMLYVKKLQIIQ